MDNKNENRMSWLYVFFNFDDGQNWYHEMELGKQKHNKKM